MTSEGRDELMAATSISGARPSADRLAMHRAGLWLFIISESFLFAAFLSARYYLTGFDKPPELSLVLGLVLTAVLAASSVTAKGADTALAEGRGSACANWLVASAALDLLFVAGVLAVEWPAAFAHFPIGTAFGTAFLSLTGLHAFHVVSGAVVLLLAAAAVRRGTITRDAPWGGQRAVIYAIFVDVMWLFIFATLYVL